MPCAQREAVPHDLGFQTCDHSGQSCFETSESATVAHFASGLMRSRDVVAQEKQRAVRAERLPRHARHRAGRGSRGRPGAGLRPEGRSHRQSPAGSELRGEVTEGEGHLTTSAGSQNRQIIKFYQ